MKTQDVLNAIITKNGVNYQTTVAIEELAELTKELTKLVRGKPSFTHICEEIADVEICLAQIKLLVPHSQKQIALYKSFKLRRLQTLYIDGNEK